MARALAFHKGLGVTAGRVMADNGPAYRYGALNAVLGGVRHHRAQVHPSLQPPAEWQGRADEPHAGTGMTVREALTPFIDRYNWDRSHGACGEPTPMPRTVGKNNDLAQHLARRTLKV